MLEFKNVSKKYGSVKAIDNISFKIEEGEFVFITGESGAGKTSILRLLIKEVRPTSGEVVFNGKKLSEFKTKQIPRLRQQIGAVFQDFKLLANKTVWENAEVALAVKGVEKAKWNARIKHVLSLVGLTDKADLFPAQLSGGEEQRAGIARALVVNPKIVFADEPTGNLDWDTSEQIFTLLQKVNEEGKTVIVASHNRNLVDKMKKRIISLKNGKMVSDSGEKKEKKTKK